MKNSLINFFLFYFPLFCFVQQVIGAANEISYSGKESYSSSVNLSDSKLLELAYSKNDKYPLGFYRENPDGAVYYENNRQLLFANNRDEALALAKADWMRKPYELLKVRETNKYFEFKRIYPETGYYILSRVHKSSYYEGCYPYNCPKENNAEIIGYLKFKPLSKDAVKEAIEYLWYIKNWNYAGPKVLSSSIKENQDGYTHTIEVLWLARGDWGLYDSIALHEETYYINKSTGQVKRYSKTTRSIQGHYNTSPIRSGNKRPNFPVGPSTSGNPIR